jgi:outer membrane protein TolC
VRQFDRPGSGAGPAHGAVSYIEVLSAQRDIFTTRQTLLELNYSRQANDGGALQGDIQRREIALLCGNLIGQALAQGQRVGYLTALYRHGAVSYIEVLSAQRDIFTTRQTLLELNYSRQLTAPWR